jgi:hypothetical protein
MSSISAALARQGASTCRWTVASFDQEAAHGGIFAQADGAIEGSGSSVVVPQLL